MNFVEELKWRGMLHDMTPGADDLLESGKITGYIGFDPTAPSMTIGNFVQLQLLKLFQLSGHQPIVLMGGATGRIGDPSFKDKERELKTEDELDTNLRFQLEQVKKFLDFDGPNAAIVVNNYDFYKDMNVLAFLRDVGKTLTVNYMMSKDSVKNRLETGLSFTEFSYQLLQAYDFLVLYQKYGCRIQMGGSDQWGNITSGTEFIRRHLEDGKAYAVTTPLLTKADGKKFGKSEEGNIWLDPNRTSAYKFYQFWINADDADISKYIRYFTLKTKQEVIDMEETHRDNPRMLKQLLAEELTARVHSPEDLASVQKVTELLFGKTYDSPEALQQFSPAQLEMVKGEITYKEIPSSLLNENVSIIDLISDHTGIVASKSEARKAIQNKAVSVNKQKVEVIEHTVSSADLLHGQYLMVENGKKNKVLVGVRG
ncbi:MAG: tyrosine--tRNA ligase [Saprospiraceae bacterium]|jgi:tyrosyl-tRNA synthetase|nr:tyrosine--tRNA ligase [Saprospiraceae bacterium]MBP9194276.1 tyrosine--tRNA ligase [Saprospiraceae bacterium]